jgi:hypothetical protein
MQSVKKYDDHGVVEIIPFDRAVTEIVFHNYGPMSHAEKTKTENENKVQKLLNQGYILNTKEFHYIGINPTLDTLNNIDDDVGLDNEGG